MEFWVKSCQQSNNSVKKKSNFNYSVSCLKLGSDLLLSIELQGFPGSVLVRASRDLNTGDYWGNLAESPLELAQTLDTISFTINQQKQITSKSLQGVAAIIAHWSCPTHTCTHTRSTYIHIGIVHIQTQSRDAHEVTHKCLRKPKYTAGISVQLICMQSNLEPNKMFLSDCSRVIWHFCFHTSLLWKEGSKKQRGVRKVEWISWLKLAFFPFLSAYRGTRLQLHTRSKHAANPYALIQRLHHC